MHTAVPRRFGWRNSRSLMKTPRRVWVVVAFATAVAVAYFVLHRGEPEYAGKPLSHWLSQLKGEPPHDPPVPEAEAAVRAIGTNALPLLLKYLTDEDSPIKKALREFEASQPLIKLGLKPEGTKAVEAANGYVALAEIAAPAVPDLVVLVNSQDAANKELAGAVLPYLGSAGFDATVKLLSSPNKAIRESAAFHLAWPVSGRTNQLHLRFENRYRQQAANSLPVLIGLLKDNDADVARSSTFALGRLRLRPDEVIPALTNLAANETVPLKVRIGAIDAVGRFDKPAEPVVLFLHSLTNDSNPRIRGAASNAVWRIGGAFSTNLDAEKSK